MFPLIIMKSNPLIRLVGPPHPQKDRQDNPRSADLDLLPTGV